MKAGHRTDILLTRIPVGRFVEERLFALMTVLSQSLLTLVG